MGCGNSSAADPAKPQVTGVRRRLSVGEVSGGGDLDDQAASEEDKALLKELDEYTILKTMERNSIESSCTSLLGSVTDQGKTSFVNKTVASLGDKLDPVVAQLGFTCRKGLKPESPNQDSWCCLKVEPHFSLYGVFDGHGQKGHDVSQYVKENLPKLIIRDPRFRTGDTPDSRNLAWTAVMKDAFMKIQALVLLSDSMNKMSAQMSGTTATVAIHDHSSKTLTLAHVADSTSVLGKKKGNGSWEAVQLTRDHKPELKDERARIEKAGGKVVFDGYANYRIYAKNQRYPGLNMSRCLGDLLGHQDCGITAEPEVRTDQLDDEDQMLLLCSDGVWEFVTPKEAVDMCAAFEPKKAMPGAEKLAKESWDRWIREEGGAVVDDITVVLVFLQPAP